MDELEIIERLAGRAKQERAPALDVAPAVLFAVRARRPAGVLPLSLIAAAAALAAAVVVALAVHAWPSGADPQAALFQLVEVTRP